MAVGAEGFELPAGSNLVVAFDGLSLRMSGGCNGAGADYDVQDGVLIMQPMAMTMMACEQPLMDLDANVAGLLAAKPTVRLAGDDLTISSGSSLLRLVDQRVAVQDRELEGTMWIVTSLLSGDTASSTVPGTNATVRFVNGSAEVFAGCNRGSGAAVIGATAIEFGPLGITKMACEPAAMELELAVTTVLQGSVTYRIEGTQLTLMQGDAGLLLEAAADA